MSRAQLALERRKLELVDRADLQRFRLRLQARVMASNQPWRGLTHATQGWRRKVLVAGVVMAFAATALARQRLATSTQPAWQMAKLAARCWVAGKLGWQVARQLRAGRAPQVIQGTSE